MFTYMKKTSGEKCKSVCILKEEEGNKMVFLKYNRHNRL